jgi:hypothetical protein
MRRVLGLCAWLAIAGCSSSAAVVTPSPTPPNRSPTAAAVAVSGGCGTTQIYKGGVPDWLTSAGAGNNPNDDVPYFITSPPIAAGFIFGYPLTAGAGQNGADKILWVVGVPRGGANLDITGYPVSTGTPVVHMSRTPDSGPGEIYPTLMNVPSSGCWHFNVSWGKNQAAADLIYT